MTVDLDASPPLRSIATTDVIDRLLAENWGPPAATSEIGGEGPVVDLVTDLVARAVAERASDLHLEPFPDQVRVRFRIDGTMLDVIHLPAAVHGAVVNRLKVMADLDIVEHRRPQDGQFSTSVDGVVIDVRVATMPTLFGEKVVLRLLDTRRTVIGLSELGMEDDAAHACRRLMQAPFGLVLCTGPTGAGKTTTLYAGLLEVDTVGRNVTTIEDPVEYVVPGIVQVATNERAGLTFASGLRALLRQDPDVILVGEIRDLDTARIAVQSALTGHLVLSSLHGTDSVGALYRLLDMGLEPYLVASAVTGVVGQRLVRRICDRCRTTTVPPAHRIAFFRHHGGDPTKQVFSEGAGCDACAGTGFRGRTGVFELLVVSDTMRRELVTTNSIDDTRRSARHEGMQPLVTAGIRLVERDVTTIGEVTRLLVTV